MPLGTEVGLGPGDIVLDGDPAPPRKWAHQSPPTFRPIACSGTVAISAGYANAAGSTAVKVRGRTVYIT